jgi:hypothetical protein
MAMGNVNTNLFRRYKNKDIHRSSNIEAVQPPFLGRRGAGIIKNSGRRIIIYASNYDVRGGASLYIYASNYYVRGGASLYIYASNYYVRGIASLYMQVIKGAAQVRVRSDVTH